MDDETRLIVGRKEESILRNTAENRTLAGQDISRMNARCIDAIKKADTIRQQLTNTPHGMGFTIRGEAWKGIVENVTIRGEGWWKGSRT